MNMLFCAASPGLYSFFTTKAYPASFFPFPVEVDAILDFSACTTDNKRKTLKATNTRNRKMRADIVTMNAALSDIFLANLPKVIPKTYEPICMKHPNMVFLHMFEWFITKYGKTMAKDRKDNRQRMAADWHPSNGFEPLATCLFIGASFVSTARYPMDDCDVINIGLRIIKCCGMYSEDYKNWIARKNKTPAIVETINSFKKCWANVIALVNQTAVPASQHGYGMAAMDNNVLLALYSESLANFGAAYAATQESIKTQATSLASMQGQLTNIQQFCMNVGQQPPPNIYAPTQQQHTSNNHFGRCNGVSSGRSNGSGDFPQQPTWFGGSKAGAQQPTRPPNPYISIGRIGTSAQCMAVMLKTGTQAQRVDIGTRHTILTRPVPTSWADWSPECTRPSYRRCMDALHPPAIAPSSSSAHSNTHQGHTTQPKARLPHPHSLEECNLPAAPTTNG
jgi:hypothetical protein